MSSSSLSSAPVNKDVDVADEERCAIGWVQVATEDHPTEDGTRSSSGVLEWQLIALTYRGGWYRLSLPKTGKERERERRSSSPNVTGNIRDTASLAGRKIPGNISGPLGAGGSAAYGSPPKAMSGRGSSTSTIRGVEKGKEKEKEKESRACVLQEYRRFGRWDGWG